MKKISLLLIALLLVLPLQASAARLLILAFDTHDADPAKDKFTYKKGHIIDIKPDGNVWGKKENLPRFYQVDLDGVPVEDVQKYLDPQLDFEGRQLSIRNFKFKPDKLKAADKTMLDTDGKIKLKLKDLEDSTELN